MHNKVILNSPCLPKKTFHCGNAVGQIISEIIFLYNKKFNKDDIFYYVNDAWNLHGLPFETMYLNQFGIEGDYGSIKMFAEKHIAEAQVEKSFFSDLSSDKFVLSHSDTDNNFVEYSKALFKKMVDSKFIKLINNEYFLDLESVVENNFNSLDEVNVFPEQHKKNITNNLEMIHDEYQITKFRIFAPRVNIANTDYVINPIFQSFIYPLYISEKYKFDHPVFMQVTSAFGLKWHFLRNIVSRMLTDKSPWQNLIVHGYVLGLDGNKMSKHDNNVVQPSDLYNIIADKRFVRTVLIKSISDNRIKLQTEISIIEFKKVENYLNLIAKNKFNINDSQIVEKEINQIKVDLSKFKIKKAFDSYNLLIKKVVVDKNGEQSKYGVEIKDLYSIFYGLIE